MRINKYLAHKGYATRRAADELVERNKVLINGKVARLGDKVPLVLLQGDVCRRELLLEIEGVHSG